MLGLTGQYWLLDALLALATDNVLVKAGPVAAAFFIAWYGASDAPALARRRRILAVTLVSLFIAVALSKSVGDRIFLPRPFIEAQGPWHVEDGQLVRSAPYAYAPPLTGSAKERYERLEAGEVIDNDLNSFPSDHAALFFALALGIALAHRAAGLLALAWTLIVICGSRVAVGSHSLLDIAGGIAIGGGVLLALQLLAARLARRPVAWALRLSERWPGFTAAALFLLIFEALNTFENARDIFKALRDLLKAWLG